MKLVTGFQNSYNKNYPNKSNKNVQHLFVQSKPFKFGYFTIQILLIVVKEINNNISYKFSL